MPRLPVYLPGWESGWEPGSSGGDSGGRSHSWEHCVLREGVEPSSQWKVFLYIMYFFTFGGFFLYNFNKDCKQRLRLWWFFFFLNIGYLGALVHSRFYIVAKGFCFFSSSVLISVLSLNPRSCLTWRWWNPVCCRPLSSNGAMFFPLYSTEPSCLCKCCMVLTLDRAYKNKTWWRCCSLVLILFDRLWLTVKQLLSQALGGTCLLSTRFPTGAIILSWKKNSEGNWAEEGSDPWGKSVC